MNIKFKIIVLFVFFLLTLNASTNKFNPSFNCDKATSKVEKLICENKQLSNLDNNLSKIYNSFYYITKHIKKDQRKWIKKRDKCKNIKCIKTNYEIRIKNLNESLSNQNTFPKDYLKAIKKLEKRSNLYLISSRYNDLILSKESVIF